MRHVQKVWTFADSTTNAQEFLILAATQLIDESDSAAQPSAHVEELVSTDVAVLN